MRERAAQWAVAHSFDAVASGFVRVVESVEVNIALSATTTEMCTIHANALHPAPLHFTIQPKSWTDRVAARFGGAFETDDRDFDAEHWRVEADDETVATRLLLDARVRAALMNHPVWCHVAYAGQRRPSHRCRQRTPLRACTFSPQRKSRSPSCTHLTCSAPYR